VGQAVRVIAVTAEEHVEAALPALRTAIAAQTRGRAVAAAMSSNLAVVVVSGEPPACLPLGSGLAVCVGPSAPVEGSARSWAQARRGVRLAALRGQRAHWTTADDLGSVVVLVDLDPEDVARLTDVQAIGRLASARADDLDSQVLDELGWLPSVRDVAGALHMHHSSVAYRIDGISRVLGFDVRTPEGRYRARTALLLWQLHVRQRTPHLVRH
jgi:PucR C-terminal helix-turn-helix domain